MSEVYKFGGASIKDAEGVKNLAEIIRLATNKQLLIVVSAMGKTTNALEALAMAYHARHQDTHEMLEEIKNYHENIMLELFGNENRAAFDDVANAFVEIEWILEEDPHDDFDYTYDQIVSLGEVVSSKIVNAYLNSTGISSRWLDARGFIHTDNTYREGKVNWDKTQNAIVSQLPAILEKQVAVTQGFIGGTSENFTTTLGREGSDYTAAIFASSIKADAVTIWKDVPGVLNADPKWFDKTELMPHISYHDAIELTYYGATVIHPKTIKPLQNKSIPLYVRSFIHHGSPGTVISDHEKARHIPSFIFKVDQVLISILPKDYSFIIEESLSHIFDILHSNRVKVNTMLNSALSFSICVDNDPEKIKKLISRLSSTYKVVFNEGLELVTIRYYNQQTIDRVTLNKSVLLEVKSRHTCQMVMKNLPAG
ncbi:aspartate kinase [Desertivirga xinjiangensis]|uniref:aspartate kinase n=1 Tax=Desertivirga xinjiangensis TaxID=539206 RepID=UPI00210A42F3|nr:aspartate kinase [Pedobacter xinjiangensis]